jgi:hypothetical protein
MNPCNNKRIALIWEGAKYHSSAEVKEFLSLVNNGLDESDWKITCLRFALLRADSESNWRYLVTS